MAKSVSGFRLEYRGKQNLDRDDAYTKNHTDLDGASLRKADRKSESFQALSGKTCHSGFTVGVVAGRVQKPF
jgi:hypothetical protein